MSQHYSCYACRQVHGAETAWFFGLRAANSVTIRGQMSFETVLGLLRSYKYVAMFGVLFLCGLGLPLPEEITLVASGFAVGWEWANFWWASAACVAGILAGDAFIFGMGRYCGRWFLEARPMRWILSPRRQRKVQRVFEKHGRKTVFFARFFAGVRIGVYAYAGQHGMSWVRFLVLDLLGALISGPTSVFLGSFVAKKVADPKMAAEMATKLIHEGRHWIYAAVGLLVLLAVLHWLWTNRRGKARAEKSLLLQQSAQSAARIEVRPLIPAADPTNKSDREALPGA